MRREHDSGRNALGVPISPSRCCVFVSLVGRFEGFLVFVLTKELETGSQAAVAVTRRVESFLGDSSTFWVTLYSYSIMSGF